MYTYPPPGRKSRLSSTRSPCRPEIVEDKPPQGDDDDDNDDEGGEMEEEEKQENDPAVDPSEAQEGSWAHSSYLCYPTKGTNNTRNPKLPDPNPRSLYKSLCPKPLNPKLYTLSPRATLNPARSGFTRLGTAATELLAEENEDDLK